MERHNAAMPADRQPVRFGIVEVNLDTGEVRRAGVKIRLQERPFHVLAALLEKPGEIVTKEEPQERIWKDDTPQPLRVRVVESGGGQLGITSIVVDLRDGSESVRF